MSPTSPDRMFYLGTSGWAYRDWIGKLYPHDMPAGEFLTAYAHHFDTVEIEHTFFEIPSGEMVRSWSHKTPDGFVFSPCAPRQITHVQRLRHTQGLVEDFLAVMSDLGNKLGPILLQLPRDFRRQEQMQLETFLETLPRDQLFAIEFHHGSWLKDTTFELLEAHQIAWVTVDADFLPRVPKVTAPFAYVRWHGYPGVGQRSRRRTSPATALRPWAPILRDLARQATPVYGYIRNSFSGYAPHDCDILRELLGKG